MLSAIERLKILRDETTILATQSPYFDMGTWRRNSIERMQALSLPEPIECGTSMCLGGWAAATPALMAEGLRWHQGPEYDKYGNRMYPPQRWQIVYGDPPAKWVSGEWATTISHSLMKFFDLSSEQFSWLFIADSYSKTGNAEDDYYQPTLWQLQEHIEGVIREKQRAVAAV